MGAPPPSRHQLELYSARVAHTLHEIAEHVQPDAAGAQRLAAEMSVALEELVVADEELHAQAEELEASRDAVDAERERYVELFELLPDAVVDTDASGKIVDANDAAGRLFGVPVRALPGKLLVGFVPSAERRRIRQALTTPPVGSGETILRIVTRDGSERLVAALVGRRSRTDPHRLLWVLRDLTRTTELEREVERLGTTVETLGRLTGLQRLIGDPDTLPALIERILYGTVTLFPGADLVVRLVHRPEVACSDEIGRRLADVETAQESGPLLEAVATGRPVRCSSSELAERWGELGSVAIGSGVTGMCALPIVVDGEPVGAIAAWRHADAPDDDIAGLLSVAAEHVAIAHANTALYTAVAEHGANLARALEFRGAIERAKGMIMQAWGVSSDDAFGILREESQHRNRKLRDIAVDVTEGRVPVAFMGPDGRPRPS